MLGVTPNATIALPEQTLASEALGYALLIRAAGSGTPLTRLAMLQGKHGTRVTVNGAPQDPTSDHQSIPAGAAVAVTLAQADVSAALPLRVLAADVVLAARDATGAWSAALTWSVRVDLIAPGINTRAFRDPTNRTLITVLAPSEDTIEATVTSSAGSETRPWSGNLAGAGNDFSGAPWAFTNATIATTLEVSPPLTGYDVWKATIDANAPIIEQTVWLEAGKTYTQAFYVRGKGAAIDESGSLRFDDAGAFGNAGNDVSTPILFTSAWTRVTLTATATHDGYSTIRLEPPPLLIGEQVYFALATLNEGSAPIVYGSGEGVRDGLTGAKAFTFVLPSSATGITATTRDAAGNESSVAVDAPTERPLDPPLAPHWALPPWLADQGSTAPILAAASETNTTSDNARQQVNPGAAEGGYLDEHARVYGTPRYPRERDWQLRERMLAIPKNRATSRTPLEQHLSRVAGVPVRINDAGTGLSEGWVRLDGTRQLDGTWDLGGPGANLDPGTYLVRFDESPRVPMQWVLDELDRLRPAGILPDVRMLRFQTTRVGAIAANRYSPLDPTSLDMSLEDNSAYVAVVL